MQQKHFITTTYQRSIALYTAESPERLPFFVSMSWVTFAVLNKTGYLSLLFFIPQTSR